jgi:prevent-host-death family protein
MMNRNIDITTVRQRFGTIVDEVYYRKNVITIERKGNPLAKLVPLDGENVSDEIGASSSREAAEQLLSDLHDLPVIRIHEDPSKILRDIRNRKSNEASRYREH